MNYIPCNPQFMRSFCNETKTMVLNGKGIVQVKPDIAILSIGVITENIDLNAALKENSMRIAKVIASLINLGISDTDIKTQDYSIELNYDYVEGKQIFKGYQIKNILSITVREITSVGEVINAAISSGVNIVNNITFTLSNPSFYYQQALNLAIMDAVAKAEATENILRITVNKTPVEILEETYGYPNAVTPGVMIKSASSQIMPGQTEISANIKATFSYIEF